MSFYIYYICSNLSQFSDFEEAWSAKELPAFGVELESGCSVWHVEFADFFDGLLKASWVFPELAGFAVEQDAAGHDEAPGNPGEILVEDEALELRFEDWELVGEVSFEGAEFLDVLVVLDESWHVAFVEVCQVSRDQEVEIDCSFFWWTVKVWKFGLVNIVFWSSFHSIVDASLLDVPSQIDTSVVDTRVLEVDNFDLADLFHTVGICSKSMHKVILLGVVVAEHNCFLFNRVLIQSWEELHVFSEEFVLVLEEQFIDLLESFQAWSPSGVIGFPHDLLNLLKQWLDLVECLPVPSLCLVENEFVSLEISRRADVEQISIIIEITQ